jgi:hypothetical protein
VLSHVQPVAERREAAPGPSTVGDVRGQRAGGQPLAVIAEANAISGVGSEIAAAGSSGAAAPGLTGDFGDAPASAVAPNIGAPGVHFVGNAPAPGLASSQNPGGGAPAGFSPTSGPALVSGSGFLGGGGASSQGLAIGGIQAIAGAANAHTLGTQGGSPTGVGRI